MNDEIMDLSKFKGIQDCVIDNIPELKERFKDYYIGIVDSDGLESINKVSEMTLKELAHNIFCLDIRAKANSQRNAVFYFVKLSNDDYLKFIEKVKEKDFIEAGIIITNILDYRDKSKLTDICHSAPQVYQVCCSTFVPPKTIVSIIS